MARKPKSDTNRPAVKKTAAGENVVRIDTARDNAARNDAVRKAAEKETSTDRNPDPISGEPGAHPIGAGLGAAVVGGATGTAAGAAFGPVGAIAGAVIGGIAGGYAGKAIEEEIDPTTEDAFWEEHFPERPYAGTDTYETYRPAYQYGWESRARYPNRRFDDVEPELAQGWHARKSNLSWEQAKQATRDAWDRVEKAMPGDADKDGK